MSPADLGFLVAVPVLGAAILRVTLGNLYQAYDGRRVALLGIALSALPSVILLLSPSAPSYTLLLVLGVFLGVGGASFAVALPMAGSNYSPKVQGLVLGLAAAGNIGAVLDGFMFPGLADHFGWAKATGAALPLLALVATALFFWAKDLGRNQVARRKPFAVSALRWPDSSRSCSQCIRAFSARAKRACCCFRYWVRCWPSRYCRSITAACW